VQQITLTTLDVRQGVSGPLVRLLMCQVVARIARSLAEAEFGVAESPRLRLRVEALHSAMIKVIAEFGVSKSKGKTSERITGLLDGAFNINSFSVNARLLIHVSGVQIPQLGLEVRG